MDHVYIWGRRSDTLCFSVAATLLATRIALLADQAVAFDTAFWVRRISLKPQPRAYAASGIPVSLVYWRADYSPDPDPIAAA